MAITCSVCGVDSSTSLFKKRNRSRSCPNRAIAVLLSLAKLNAPS